MCSKLLALCASLALTLVAAAPAPIPRASPEAVGLSPARLRDASDLLSRFVTERKIAGAVAAVARKGKHLEMVTTLMTQSVPANPDSLRQRFKALVQQAVI